MRTFHPQLPILVFILTVLYAEPCSAQRNWLPREQYNPRCYAEMSRQSVEEAYRAQTLSARKLSHTLWNHHFRSESAELTPGGRAFLIRLARHPDVGTLFLQTAHDLTFDPDKPEKYVRVRQRLNENRVKAVTAYLQVVLRRKDLHVELHDPAPVGMRGEEALVPLPKLYRNAQGVLTVTDQSGASLGDASGFVISGSDGGSSPVNSPAIPSSSSPSTDLSGDVPTGDSGGTPSAPPPVPPPPM